MDAIVVRAGITVVTRELSLDFHVSVAYGEVAKSARRIDARTDPGTLSPATRKLAIVNGCPGLLSEKKFV
jgi:hypothetical protein